MKSFLSIKPGATFFLGSSQTLVYHKDSIEVIYRYQSGKKSFYTHVYMYIVDDTKVTLYADWGDYFLHLDSITQIDHFDGIMKRPCPTFVEILTNDDFEKAGIMSMNGKETMGLGMDVKVDWNGKIKPAALPYYPSVADGIVKLTESIPRSPRTALWNSGKIDWLQYGVKKQNRKRISENEVHSSYEDSVCKDSLHTVANIRWF